MSRSQAVKKVEYKPILFIIGAFLVTWVSIFLVEFLDSKQMWGFMKFFDFLKSASPLLVALFLLRKHFKEKGFLKKYFLGNKPTIISYGIVILLFVLQFFCFYIFRIDENMNPNSAPFTFPIFLVAFVGQLFFGGGLEEGGWRGYLFPALRAKTPVLLASIITSAIWTLWHLPYFIIPNSSQYGSNFFLYLLVTIMTGFILTAIYMLTKSVLLCTLFHGFQNTLVLTLQPDMSNIALMGIFFAIAISAIVICQILAVRERKNTV